MCLIIARLDEYLFTISLAGRASISNLFVGKKNQYHINTTADINQCSLSQCMLPVATYLSRSGRLTAEIESYHM